MCQTCRANMAKTMRQKTVRVITCRSNNWISSIIKHGGAPCGGGKDQTLDDSEEDWIGTRIKKMLMSQEFLVKRRRWWFSPPPIVSQSVEGHLWLSSSLAKIAMNENIDCEFWIKDNIWQKTQGQKNFEQNNFHRGFAAGLNEKRLPWESIGDLGVPRVENEGKVKFSDFAKQTAASTNQTSK